MFFQTQPMLPEDQDWIIDRMTALGYESDQGGVCLAISYMAAQAVQAGEFDEFYKRLQFINAIPVNEIEERISKIKERRINLIAQVKKNMPANLICYRIQKWKQWKMILLHKSS